MNNPEEIRPRHILKFTSFDITLECVGLFLILAIWIIPVLLYKNLPDTIPTHFGINGEADDWGSKTTIFILPVLCLLLYIGLSILNKFPHIFNYPVKVTEENAMRLYFKATLILRFAKLAIILLFLVIEWQICSVNEKAGLPIWFMPVTLAIPVLLPIILAFVLTKK